MRSPADKSIVLTIACLALVAGASAWEAARDYPEPQLTVKQPDIDLGTIVANGSATARFVLCNETTSDIAFKKVVSSCSCTKAAVKSSVVTPGECSELTAIYRPGSSLGAAEATIYLLYQVADQSELRRSDLTVSCVVVKGDAVTDKKTESADIGS